MSSTVPSDLGQRILAATRLAVTEHWQQQFAAYSRQHDAMGGALASRVTEDQLSQADDGGAGNVPRRLSRIPRLSSLFRRSRR